MLRAYDEPPVRADKEKRPGSAIQFARYHAAVLPVIFLSLLVPIVSFAEESRSIIDGGLVSKDVEKYTRLKSLIGRKVLPVGGSDPIENQKRNGHAYKAGLQGVKKKEDLSTFPEPSLAFLLITGLIALTFSRWRKSR